MRICAVAKDIRLVLLIDQELDELIYNFRFDKKLETKAEATRQLIVAGLEKLTGYKPKPKPSNGSPK